MKNDVTIAGFRSKDGSLSYLHSIADPPEPIPVEHHTFYEISFLISGDIRRFVEGMEYPSEKGDLLFINHRELHRLGIASPKPYERINIHFDRRVISGIDSEGYNILEFIENRKLGHGNMISGTEIENAGIVRLFERIEQYIESDNGEAPLLIKITFIEILAKLNALFREKRGRVTTPIHDDERVTSLLEHIHQNLEKKLTLEILSRKFNINKYHLCRIFKKGTGFTVNEYITNKRIIRVKEYLVKGIPVIESCYRAGFSDYSNFYRIFKTATGLTPRQFVKQYDNLN